MNITEAKTRARKLQQILKTAGHQVKLWHCYEILSELEGHPNWDAYCAILKRTKNDPKSNLVKV